MSKNNNKDKDNGSEDIGYIKMEPRRTTCLHPTSSLAKRGVYPNKPVFYHKDNDLLTAFGYGFRPEDAIPKKGPGVVPEVERQFTPSNLLSDFTYTNWTESIMPLNDSNLAEGLSEALTMIANVAAKGTSSLKHDDLYLTVQFLSTLTDDAGNIPPNILAFIEHVDYLTKNDGTELDPEYLAMQNKSTSTPDLVTSESAKPSSAPNLKRNGEPIKKAVSTIEASPKPLPPRPSASFSPRTTFRSSKQSMRSLK